MSYMVGGFFSFIGKAIKKVTHVVGKVVGTAVGVASVLVPGPAGRIVAGIGGKLAGLGNTIRSVQGNLAVLKGSVTTRGGLSEAGLPLRGNMTQGMSAGLLGKLSNVMPGGAVATVGNKGARVRSGKRKASRKRSTGKRRKRSTGRKLKFGSAAYRKKYLGHR
jgi:hypothetical protein